METAAVILGLGVLAVAALVACRGAFKSGMQRGFGLGYGRGKRRKNKRHAWAKFRRGGRRP